MGPPSLESNIYTNHKERLRHTLEQYQLAKIAEVVLSIQSSSQEKLDNNVNSQTKKKNIKRDKDRNLSSGNLKPGN